MPYKKRMFECNYCNKQFEKRSKQGVTQYCSVSCSARSSRKIEYKECVECGNFFNRRDYKSGSKLEPIKRWEQRKFCSISCSKKGEKHHRYKERIVNSSGYVVVHKPQHPFCAKDGLILEHRLVMEKKLGRYLKKNEIVHHIDFEKQNNNINNLHLFSNLSEHSKFHRFLERCVLEEIDQPKEQVA